MTDQVAWTTRQLSGKKKFRACVSGLLAGGSLGSVAGLALVLLVLCWLLVIQDLNLMFRLTVSPAKRASPKFMKMVSFGSSHSL